MSNTSIIKRSLSQQVAGLAGWLLVTFAAAGAGAAAPADAGAFYAQLNRPAWAPPGWLFGPVWATLYFVMAVAAWLVWRRHGLDRSRPALSLFIAQLAGNGLWTWLFFGWRLGLAAFVEILLLWILIAAVVIAFWRLHRAAALLLLPYLGWVTFASALTLSTWQRNPALLS